MQISFSLTSISSQSIPLGLISITLLAILRMDVMIARESLSVPQRFDLFKHYQDILNQPLKLHWGDPQAFGNESFWMRYPSADEEIVMNVSNKGLKVPVSDLHPS